MEEVVLEVEVVQRRLRVPFTLSSHTIAPLPARASKAAPHACSTRHFCDGSSDQL